MPFSLDARRRRLAHLASALDLAPDGELSALLAPGDVPAASVILALLPLERSSRIIAALPAVDARAALATCRSGVDPEDHAVKDLLDRLRKAGLASRGTPPPQPGEGLSRSARLCERALDIAGRILGAVPTDPRDDGKADPKADPGSR